MPVNWRPIVEEDLLSCLALQAAHRGEELVGVEAALAVWRRLLCDPFFVAIAFESDPPVRGHRIVGFGASAIVSAAFMDDELAHPRPNVNSRIIASVHLSRSVLLSRDEIAHANAGEGIDVVVLYGSWREEILSPGESVEVKTMLPSIFTKLHSGYRIRRIVWETIRGHEEEFALFGGVYRTVGEFPETGRMSHLMTASSANAVPGSLANILFRYVDPLLRLRESDQQLLRAAQDGATDGELTAELGLTLTAVKARWRSAFARIGEVKPDLMVEADSGEGRGLQKRHRVLAHIREHPEELRPYAWGEKFRIRSPG